jgi:hypothetical protein
MINVKLVNRLLTIIRQWTAGFMLFVGVEDDA